MSKTKIAVVEKLDESKTEGANVKVVHNNEKSKPHKAFKKHTKIRGSKANEAKEAATDEAIAKKRSNKDLQTEETKVGADDSKIFLRKKVRPRFIEASVENVADDENDEIDDDLAGTNSKLEELDVLSLPEAASKNTVLDTGFIEELNEGLEDLEDSSDDSIVSYIHQKEIDMGLNFFDVIGTIPDVVDISSDISVISLSTSEKTRIDSLKDMSLDYGTFVNPLTGEAQETKSATEIELEEEIDFSVVEEVEEESWCEYLGKEDDDLLVFVQRDQEAEPEKKRASIETVLETFLEMVNDFDEPPPTIDYAAQEQEAARQQLLVITIDFISQLINQVVKTCEYVDPHTILRNNLNKIELMDQLDSTIVELDVEHKASVFLDRKIVDHFRRKKKFRSILADNPDTVTEDKQKLKNATAKLDRMMGRMAELKSIIAARLANLNLEVSLKEEDAKNEIKIFEDIVKNGLRRDLFTKLPQVVTDLLSRIQNMRDEVSEVRFILIQRQHTFASLVEKLDKLENVGVGLSITEFDVMLTQTQALGKKIEEKNSELNRLRIRCNADLHIMSHLKENQNMLRSTLSIRQSALDDLLWQKKNLRAELFYLKASRTKIRKELYDLSMQSGIMSKPALLFDYDDTIDRLKILQNTVKNTKYEYASLQKKIRNLESKCE